MSVAVAVTSTYSPGYTGVVGLAEQTRRGAGVTASVTEVEGHAATSFPLVALGLIV